jgi:lysophospholipase L1-like esterase
MAITLAIPVLFCFLLELGLRVAGFGQSYLLFIPVAEAPQYLRANPKAVARYIFDESKVPDVEIRPVPFLAEKSPGAFRIFVQGESTTAGYPYGYDASLAGMLQQRLQRTFPQRDIEVITTAMAAVNSYTLLDLADEIIARQPDAILIYVGHNEYLGFLGVASAYSAGRSRPLVLAYLALRDLRIGQLLKRGYLAVFGSEDIPPGDADTERTLMARVVREPHIPLGSSLYRRGVEQFRANLSALLARYWEAGVPVFIGTLVSNERDLKPFISGLDPKTDAARWKELYNAGESARRAGRPEEAAAAISAAIALDDTAADAYFALGELLDDQGRSTEARRAYLAAKDRDQLRFRAPEEFNAIIRTAAADYGARIVDVQGAFVRESRDGILGEDLLLEHVHPNLRGYFLLADAYYDALQAAGLIGGWENKVSREDAWRDIPVTEVDRINARYQILRLKSDWPYERRPRRTRIPQPSGYVDELAYKLFRGELSWPEATRRLLSHLRLKHDDTEAARVALLLADAFPYDVPLQVDAATLAARAGRKLEAAVLLWRAARTQAAAGDNPGARHSLEQLLELSPGDPRGRRLLDVLQGAPETTPGNTEVSPPG